MNILRQIPKLDILLNDERFSKIKNELLKNLARNELTLLRNAALKAQITQINTEEIIQNILNKYHFHTSYSLKSLINATGVIIHTNLGRSPIGEEIFSHAKKIACSYNNLEYDMKKGSRGERYSHVNSMLCKLLNVEDALIVNNNAAAVFLVLNSFARKRKVIVSRGELVEIGGSFRIPEVMKEARAKLIEIGTTNKTRLSDYEKAIDEKTSVLLKVHRSNFDIVGFSEDVEFAKLTKLAKKHGLIDYYDVGGAYLKVPNLPFYDKYLELQHILSFDPSLLSFSADKLLGSIQAGIIVGKKELINKLKNNQLLRMLRVDKLTLSILEATFHAYLNENLHQIPTIFLLRRSLKELEKMALDIKNATKIDLQIVHTKSYVGGGSMPNRPLDSIALALDGKANQNEQKFRSLGIIGRIENDKFLLDLKALLPQDLQKLIEILKANA